MIFIAISSVKYTSFDKALGMPARALVSHLGIKSAFRLFHIHTLYFNLVGHIVQGIIFNDQCILFCCFVRCSKLKIFSTFLEWALKVKSQSTNVVQYLDGFLLAGC